METSCQHNIANKLGYPNKELPIYYTHSQVGQPNLMAFLRNIQLRYVIYGPSLWGYNISLFFKPIQRVQKLTKQNNQCVDRHGLLLCQQWAYYIGLILNRGTPKS